MEFFQQAIATFDFLTHDRCFCQQRIEEIACFGDDPLLCGVFLGEGFERFFFLGDVFFQDCLLVRLQIAAGSRDI